MAELGARADISIAEVTGKAAEVEALVGNKQLPAALLKALEDPPVLSKEKELKKVAAEAVFKVFDAIADKDIPAAVDAVGGAGPAQLDLLLKYVYLGLSQPRPPTPPVLARTDTPLTQPERSQLEAVLLEQKKWSTTLLKWQPQVSSALSAIACVWAPRIVCVRVWAATNKYGSLSACLRSSVLTQLPATLFSLFFIFYFFIIAQDRGEVWPGRCRAGDDRQKNGELRRVNAFLPEGRCSTVIYYLFLFRVREVLREESSGERESSGRGRGRREEGEEERRARARKWGERGRNRPGVKKSLPSRGRVLKRKPGTKKVRWVDRVYARQTNI
jgi:hypothetical protein